MDVLTRDHNGYIRLYDGTIVYVDSWEYSADGKTFWESTFNPFEHYYENDGQTLLQGHKYMRIRHAGDTVWQVPAKIVGDDGLSPELRVYEEKIQWGYPSIEDSWQDIVTLEELKGPQGDTGPEGRGLEVNASGWYGEFIDSYPTQDGCTACNKTGQIITDPWLVLSLGDGNHVITSADQTGGKFRSDDGVNWIAIGVNDVGRKTRFIADDVLGTNFIDYRKTDIEYLQPSGTRGRVYAFSEGIWVEMDGVTASNYLVAPSVAKPTEGKFLDDYSSDTIGLDASDNLEVKEDSIGPEHFKPTTFVHGLENTGAEVNVVPSEFDGWGVTTYTSNTNSRPFLAFAPNDVIDDGLATVANASVDGEDNLTVKVNPPDLVQPALDGLTTYTDVDGYDNFRVIAGDCIALDANGVNVIGDELTISADNLTAAVVTPTDNNTKGIQALHLHQNTVNPAKGLQKGDGTATDILGAIEVKVDMMSLDFNTNGELEIALEGVEGKHLNPNVPGDGLELDALQLKVKLAAGGGLSFDGAGALQAAAFDLTNQAVTSLNGLTDDLTLVADNSGAGASGISLAINPVGSNINLELSADLNDMKTWLGIEGGTYAPIVHTHTIPDVTGLQAALDTKLTEGTIYGGNMRIDDVNGLQLLDSTSGKWFKLIVTGASGNLDTEEI